jgi:hypothetical protein
MEMAAMHPRGRVGIGQPGRVGRDQPDRIEADGAFGGVGRERHEALPPVG